MIVAHNGQLQFVVIGATAVAAVVIFSSLVLLVRTFLMMQLFLLLYQRVCWFRIALCDRVIVIAI